MHSLTRRASAAVERYESASGSLGKMGIVLEARGTIKNRKKMEQ